MVVGADFLLSMVETHWTARNRDASKMESGLRAQQELKKIEQQIAHLESAAGQDEETRREIQQLHRRVILSATSIRFPCFNWCHGGWCNIMTKAKVCSRLCDPGEFLPYAVSERGWEAKSAVHRDFRLSP